MNNHSKALPDNYWPAFKKLSLAFCILLSAFSMKAQTYYNEIQARNNSGTIEKVRSTNNNLKVTDSLLKVVLDAINAKITAVNTGAVTISSSLPAGTNAIGKLSANSGVDIGDVDVTSVPADPFGANADAASATGSISAKLRFIAATGIPITGNVTVTQGTATNLKTQAEVYQGGSAVASGNPLQVTLANTGANATAIKVDNSAVTQPVSGTVAFSNTTIATTNAGTFAVQPASATAPVSTMNSSSANSGINSALAGVFDDTSPTAITENSFGFLRMSTNRNLYGTIRDAAGNERGANVNASNELLVAVSSIPSHAVTNAGTFAVQLTGATNNINNISGTVSLPTGASTLTEQQTQTTSLQLIDDIIVAQGTALGTTKNGLMAGSVTTAAPTYTTGNINPFSLQTNGSLRTAITDALPAGTNAIGKLASNTGVTIGAVEIASSQTLATVTSLTQFNGNAIALNTGTRSAGTLRVTIATDDIVPASQSGTWTVQPGNTANTTAWLVSQRPATSGGLDTKHLVSTASTNITQVKASAGQLYGYYIFNANAAARKVIFYNTTSSPTVGTTTELFSVVIPASSGANVEYSNGITFSTGLYIATVTGTADSDATAVAAGDLMINLFYK